MQNEGWHIYYVYILMNQNKTVLYTGMTNHLADVCLSTGKIFVWAKRLLQLNINASL